MNVADATNDDSIFPVRRRRKINSRNGTESLKEQLAAVVEKGKQANRTHLRSKLKKGPQDKDAIIAAWKLAYEEFTGDLPVPTPTVGEVGRLLKVTKSQPIEDIPQFFADVCNNWKSIAAGQLKWCDDMPVAPCFMFLCRMARYIQAALSDVAYSRSKLKRSQDTIKNAEDDARVGGILVTQGGNRPRRAKADDVWVDSLGNVRVYNGDTWVNYAGVDELDAPPPTVTPEQIEQQQMERWRRYMREGGPEPAIAQIIDTDGDEPEKYL